MSLFGLALTITALFTALGFWQLDRAAQKRSTFAEFEQRGHAAKVDLNVDDGASGHRATAAGRYVGATILLDNQVHRGRAGYLVYSVFALDGRNQKVLINRGWITPGSDRSRAPEFATPIVDQQLEGRLNLPPQAGLRIAGSDMIERLGADLWRVQAIDFSALSTAVGGELLPTTMLLNDDAPYGFVRAWTPPASDENRHLGYAFQWFALAVTVVVVTVVLTLCSHKGP